MGQRNYPNFTGGQVADFEVIIRKKRDMFSLFTHTIWIPPLVKVDCSTSVAGGSNQANIRIKSDQKILVLDERAVMFNKDGKDIKYQSKRQTTKEIAAAMGKQSLNMELTPQEERALYNVQNPSVATRFVEASSVKLDPFDYVYVYCRSRTDNQYYPVWSGLISTVTDSQTAGGARFMDIRCSDFMKILQRTRALSSRAVNREDKINSYTADILKLMKELTSNKTGIDKLKNTLDEIRNGKISTGLQDTFMLRMLFLLEKYIEEFSVQKTVLSDESGLNEDIVMPANRISSYLLDGNPSTANHATNLYWEIFKILDPRYIALHWASGWAKATQFFENVFALVNPFEFVLWAIVTSGFDFMSLLRLEPVHQNIIPARFRGAGGVWKSLAISEFTDKFSIINDKIVNPLLMEFYVDEAGYFVFKRPSYLLNIGINSNPMNERYIVPRIPAVHFTTDNASIDDNYLFMDWDFNRDVELVNAISLREQDILSTSFSDTEEGIYTLPQVRAMLQTSAMKIKTPAGVVEKEILINADGLQNQLGYASAYLAFDIFKNNIYYQTLRSDKDKVLAKGFPPELIQNIRKLGERPLDYTSILIHDELQAYSVGLALLTRNNLNRRTGTITMIEEAKMRAGVPIWLPWKLDEAGRQMVYYYVTGVSRQLAFGSAPTMTLSLQGGLPMPYRTYDIKELSKETGITVKELKNLISKQKKQLFKTDNVIIIDKKGESRRIFEQLSDEESFVEVSETGNYEVDASRPLAIPYFRDVPSAIHTSLEAIKQPIPRNVKNIVGAVKTGEEQPMAQSSGSILNTMMGILKDHGFNQADRQQIYRLLATIKNGILTSTNPEIFIVLLPSVVGITNQILWNSRFSWRYKVKAGIGSDIVGTTTPKALKDIWKSIYGEKIGINLIVFPGQGIVIGKGGLSNKILILGSSESELKIKTLIAALGVGRGDWTKRGADGVGTSKGNWIFGIMHMTGMKTDKEGKYYEGKYFKNYPNRPYVDDKSELMWGIQSSEDSHWAVDITNLVARYQQKYAPTTKVSGKGNIGYKVNLNLLTE